MSAEKRKRRKCSKQQPASVSKAGEHEGTDQFDAAESQSKLSVQETCDLIAVLSEAILEDPEHAFVSIEVEVMDEENGKKTKKGYSKMQQLLLLAKSQRDDNERYTAQLAIMSILAIFKDILPSYRIRVPTVQEMAVKVSKETKKLWDYERALLHHYQVFLKLLEKTFDDKSSTLGTVSVTAMISMAELLKSAYHFNFRSYLITAVVRQMNAKKASVRDACCEAVQYVFANDAQGEVALETARQVAKVIKDRGFQVQAQALKTFLSLPLRVHADEAEAAKLAASANAKKRKRDKETAQIESELREGQSTVDKLILARCQSDTLQAVILTYFRILKADNLKSSHIKELLPAALEGLAKYVHLINIDTVMDLLAVFKDLLKRVDTIPLDSALNCILTAFTTLQGPGRELKIDPKEYIVPLYSQLPRLCGEENSWKHTATMLQCLEAVFIKRREFSTVRVAAFLKRLATTALHAPPYTAVTLLAFCQQLIQRYEIAEQMLENEQDVITSGNYNADVDDPEHSNPFATSVWELAMLKFHVHSGVASQAVAAASAKMLEYETPEKIRATSMRNTQDLYIPFKRIKKKHPLQSKPSEKKRNQLRFVTPRSYDCKVVN